MSAAPAAFWLLGETYLIRRIRRVVSRAPVFEPDLVVIPDAQPASRVATLTRFRSARRMLQSPLPRELQQALVFCLGGSQHGHAEGL